MHYFTDPYQFKPQDVISLDTEYSELDIKKAELLSVSIGTSFSTALVIPPTLLHSINYSLRAAKIIYTQNGSVDWWMLKRNGIELDRSKFRDCMLMEHLHDENVQHNLGDMVFRYFGDNYKEEFWSRYSNFQEASQDDRYYYEVRDACYTFALGDKFSKLISNTALIDHVHRLYWALFDTEIEGIRVDLDLMVNTKTKMKEQIEGYLPLLRKEFNEYCNIWELNKWGEEIDKRSSDKGKAGVKRPIFSFSSDSQLRWLLYDSEGLNCPILEKTKKGSPKTDYETIRAIAETQPELQPLVEYKGVKGVYATFVEGMLDRVENGRIYPSFNVNGTRNAGRISHSNPNMGNIPKEGPIRNFFIPNEGMCIIGADYSQLEVIIEANLTEDKSLLKIILEGASKHDITAQGLGVSRETAKTLNFALQYGAGAYKISKLLDISIQEATNIFNRYWELYSGVKSLKEKTAKQIQDTGMVKTLFGRYRHFPKPKTEYEKFRFERQGYNAIIQGTGADCTNMATYLIGEYLRKEGLGRLWFSVHDEIVCEVQNFQSQQSIEYLMKCMEAPSEKISLKYPLQCKPYGPLQKWEKA